MDRWAGKVAIVTGTSAGIGLETAKALVRIGMIVVGLSRRVDKMQDGMNSISGSGKFYPKACDVTNENEIKEAFEWVETNFQSVHVLVNNAGCAKFLTNIQDMKTEDLKNVIDVNVVGLLLCTRYAMKIMKKNDHDAHIIHINSNVGHRVPPFKGINVYPATKYAVTAISETLIQEIAGEKIRVTSISPGVVKTEFFDVAADPSYLSSRPALNSEDVARSIVHALSAPQHVQITELIIKPLGQLH